MVTNVIHGMRIVSFENGSYFRLKNISIGYNLKKEWLKNLGIDKLRFYATGSNLLTLQAIPGLILIL